MIASSEHESITPASHLDARMTGTEGPVAALKIVNDRKPATRLISPVARNMSADRGRVKGGFKNVDGDDRRSKRKRAETMAGFDDLGVKFKLTPRKNCWLAHFDRTVDGLRDRSRIAELSLSAYKEMRDANPGRKFRPALRQWVVDRIAERAGH